MPSPKKTYEHYQLVPGLDAAILRTLPDEGSLVGNLYPSGRQTRGIAKALATSGVTPAMASGRIKVLEHHGFVVKVVVMPVSSGPGWQITKAGKDYIDKEAGS